MINSRSAYDFVTFPDGVAVNGGIMPLRSGSAANALRLEDVGFLYEAMCERQTEIGETANYATLTKAIRAFPLSTVANALTALASKYLQEFEPTKVAVSSADGNTIAGIYGNASTAPTASFAAGGPLVAANVKNLFDSVSTMRQFEAEGTVTAAQSDLTHTYSYGPDERFNKQTFWDFTYKGLLIWYCSNSFSTNSSNVGGAVLEPADGGYEFEIRATAGTYQVAAELEAKYLAKVVAVAIMRTQLSVRAYTGATETTTTTNYYAVPVAATYEDGVVTVALADLLAVADDLAGAFERPGYKAKAYNIYEWDVYVLDILALCKLGEHTKI